MATSFEIPAEVRTDKGKGASRRLRRAGRLPAIIYGGSKEPQSITLDHDWVLHSLDDEAFFSHILSLKFGDVTEKVLLRDLQRHPYKPTLVHADFQRVAETDRIHLQVPLHFVGEDVAPGVKQQGGRVAHELTEADVSCLARDLPEYIEVDVSQLSVGDVLHLSDIQLPEGVAFTELQKGGEHDLPVVTIHGKGAGVEGEGEGEGEEAAAE